MFLDLVPEECDGLGLLFFGGQRRNISFQHGAVIRSTLFGALGISSDIGYFRVDFIVLILRRLFLVFGRIVGVAVGFYLVPDLVYEIFDSRSDAVTPMLRRYVNQRKTLWLVACEAIEQLAQHRALVSPIL